MTHPLYFLKLMIPLAVMALLSACMGIDDYETVKEDPVYDWIDSR